jgi:hypothetical protein
MRLIIGSLGIVTVAACTASPAAPRHIASPAAPRHIASPNTASASPSPSLAGPVTRAGYARCPKTALRHVMNLPGEPAGQLVPGTTFYGNGKLFTLLNLNGVLLAPADMVKPDGSIGWKFPWWRYATGHITITGRRLDAPAGQLMSYVPAGYGDTGFQATGVTFPSEGCWQVTAKMDHTALTFVTFVIKVAHSAVIR